MINVNLATVSDIFGGSVAAVKVHLRLGLLMGLDINSLGRVLKSVLAWCYLMTTCLGT